MQAQLSIELLNVGETAEFRVWSTPLFDSEEQAQPCELGEAAATVELARATGPNLDLTLPACRAFVLRQVPTDDKSSYHVAVAGGLDVSDDMLRSFLEDVRDSGRWDFLAILGSVRIDGADDRYQLLREEVEGVKFPVGVGVGPEEVGTDYRDVASRFGATDYVTNIGLSPLVVLDTADRIQSNRQFSMIAGIADDNCGDACPPGAMLTWVSPVEDSRATRDGFSSVISAQSLLAELDRRNIRLIMGGSGDAPSNRSLGKVQSIEVRRARRIEDLATLTFGLPAEDAELCTSLRSPTADRSLFPSSSDPVCADGKACVSGTCRERCSGPDETCSVSNERCFDAAYCRPVCSTDDDCAGAAQCGSGFCDLLPSVLFEY